MNTTPTEAPSREDFDRLSADLTRAKNLLVRLHSKHPEARAQIEGSTGSWFIWGTDRDASPPPEAQAPSEPTPLDDMRARKDAAYLERNRVVAALASAYPSGIARTAIEGWSEDWNGCVYIDLPTGQASWHYHDSHAHLFEHLPSYQKAWDGHTTEEKYERLAALAALPTLPVSEQDKRDAARLHWLHSPASNNVDGYEWGIYRVKWVNGKAAEVWQTNGDFSDLDAAINAALKGEAP